MDLLEEVGRGAFGIVYRAWDASLEREVALKLIPAGQGAESEARLLARIHHENVVTVYGVDEVEGSLGIWMEYIRGRNLAQLVETHGRMSAREAASIGLDVCRALAEVHRKGLLHRDIKAQNVMRADGGRVIVMDFGLGLGKIVTSTPKAEELCGTPLYMAPELFRGESATFATDIYSLGVLLYHLTTLSFPVLGKSLVELEAAHASGARRSIRDERPGLSEDFVKIVERATAPLAADRFHSAGNLMQSIVDFLESSTRSKHRTPSQKRRRVLLSIFATVVLVALSAFLVTWLSRLHVKAGSTIFLCDFPATDPELRGITEAIRAQLSQSAYFNLADPRTIADTLATMGKSRELMNDPQTARELAWRENIPVAVFGALDRVGSEYVLNVRVEEIGPQPLRARKSWRQSFSATSRREIFDAVNDAGRWIRKLVGEAERDINELNLRPQDVTTDSWEALKLFGDAERLKVADKDAEAVLLLKEAVQKDPHFALAYMRLGDIEVHLDRYEEGYAYWQKALDNLNTRPLTKREELRIRGLHATDSGDYREAEQVFQTYSVLYPNDYLPWFYRARPLMLLGRVEEAIATLKEAEKRNPAGYYMPYSLAQYNMILGRFGEAQKYIQRMRSLGQAVAAEAHEGAARWLEGNPAEALRKFRALRGSPDSYWQPRSYSLEAFVDAETGRYNDALDILNRGISEDIPSGRATARADRLLAAAYIHFYRGEMREARAECLNALRFESGLRNLLSAGTVLARAGFTADAVRILKNIDGMPQGVGLKIAHHRLEGEIALVGKDWPKALAEFQKADELDAPILPREYLARALAIHGDAARALPLYKAITDSPGVVWLNPLVYPPGFWSRCLFEYATLAAELGQPEARPLLERYIRIRTESDSGAVDLIKARKLLSMLSSITKSPGR